MTFPERPPELSDRDKRFIKKMKDWRERWDHQGSLGELSQTNDQLHEQRKTRNNTRPDNESNLNTKR